MTFDRMDALALIPGSLSGLLWGCFVGLLCGCSAPHDTKIDDAFAQVLCMQFQLQPSEIPAPEQPVRMPDHLRDVTKKVSSTEKSTEKTPGASDGSAEIASLPRPEQTAAEAPKPRPLLKIYGYDGCAACKYVCNKFDSLGLAYTYEHVKPKVDGEYPYAEQCGKKIKYDDLLKIIKQVEDMK